MTPPLIAARGALRTQRFGEVWTEALSDLLEDACFQDVTARTVLAGMLGFHRAVKPPA